MSPLVAFLLGIGLMMLSIGCATWIGLDWLCKPENLAHIISGLFSSQMQKCRGVVVLDEDGQERRVTWKAMQTAVLRVADRRGQTDPGAYF